MTETQEMKHTPELYPPKASILSALNRMRRIMSGELPRFTPGRKSPKQCLICGGWIGRCKNERRARTPEVTYEEFVASQAVRLIRDVVKDFQPPRTLEDLEALDRHARHALGLPERPTQRLSKL